MDIANRDILVVNTVNSLMGKMPAGLFAVQIEKGNNETAVTRREFNKCVEEMAEARWMMQCHEFKTTGAYDGYKLTQDILSRSRKTLGE